MEMPLTHKKGTLFISAITTLFLSWSFFGNVVHAEDEHKVKDRESCVTSKTGISGKRPTCRAHTKIEPPTGYAFDPATIKVNTVHHRGTGHGCTDKPKLHYKQISRLAKVVVKVTHTGNARAYKRSHGGRGRVECELSGVYIKM